MATDLGKGFPLDSILATPQGFMTFIWSSYLSRALSGALASADLPSGITSWLNALPTSAPSASHSYWWDPVAGTLKRTP